MKSAVRVAASIIFSLSLLISAHSTFAESPEEAIESFKNDPSVQAEINRLRKRFKWTREDFQVVSLGEGCGVRGCSYRQLVVMYLSKRGGANPQSESVLATVDSASSKKKPKVTLVELKPKGVPTELKAFRGYSAPLPTLKRVD